MFKGFVASAVAACLLAMPVSSAFARSHQSAPEMVDILAQSQGEIVSNTIREQLVDAGLNVGLTDSSAIRAVTDVFGPHALDDNLAVSVVTGQGVDAVVLLPLDLADLKSRVLPVALYGENWASGYQADLSGDNIILTDRDGVALLEVSMSFDGEGSFVLDPVQTEIFAIDLPIDIDLDPVIEILQALLDVLYTVKALINSVICAVQAAIDLLYGMDNCGFGDTVLGGGAVYDVVVCSAGEIQDFASTVQNYCF